ncbi:MAG: peptidase M50 [Candidatus Woesearchaeota archaeon]
MKFSDIEKKHLFRAWIAISLAFGILLSNGNFMSSGFLIMLLVSAFTVGIGFLLHEIAHKYVAQKYRCYAEFRASNKMLLLAIAMSFFGFIFAAPGAVMIRGWVDTERNGKISIAGPIVNIVLALGFFGAILIGFVNIFTTIGFFINSLIAAFNLIPVWNFDGAKVLRWNKAIYFVALGISVILLVLGYGYI